MLGPDDADSRPNLLVLQSSSYDLSKGQFFDAMTGNRAEAVSPQHLVRAGLVPALLLHTAYDHLTPIDEFRRFVDTMQSLENDFEYHVFENAGHFFRNDEASERADRMVDDFLRRRGFITR